MNTEKAIDLLDNLISMVDDNQENDYDSALHMAIDVLKTQADTDTVSRKAVLDAVCEELDSIDHVPQWVFDRLTKKIENLPPAQPTGTPLHDNGSDYSHGFADGYKNGLKDAKSQRKGYWRHYEGYLTCSECGDEYYADIMAYCGDNVPKFCPNCGADMREDAEEARKCDTCKHEKER